MVNFIPPLVSKKVFAKTGELSHVKKGSEYENVALAFLLDQGLSLVARNYRGPRGELDLLMLDGNAFVVIEVRYRKNNRYGSALESVTHTKQARIIATTKHYIMHHQIDRAMRFDVVAITGNELPNWIKNAF